MFFFSPVLKYIYFFFYQMEDQQCINDSSKYNNKIKTREGLCTKIKKNGKYCNNKATDEYVCDIHRNYIKYEIK